MHTSIKTELMAGKSAPVQQICKADPLDLFGDIPAAPPVRRIDSKDRYRANAKAPITKEQRNQLKFDATHVKMAATRKGLACDCWEEADETRAAACHFELGCWLFYFAHRRPFTLEERIECVRRLFDAGITRVGYRFASVFDFGERHFDDIFEEGDGDLVIAGLRKVALADPDGGVAKAFEIMGWPLGSEETCS